MAFATVFVACAGESGIEVAGPPAVTGGSGGKSDAGLQLQDGGSGTDAKCVADKLETEVVKMPLDLVIYLDSSDSMGNALSKIKATFTQSFAGVMDQSGIDFIVITIAAADTITSPTNPSKYFFYPRGTGSGEIPLGFLNTFDQPPGPGKLPAGGWSDWSRLEAFKALFAITDSGSGPKTAATEFENQLYDVKKFPGFGTQANRNYRFHFMSGFIPKPTDGGPDDFWLPSDPVVTQASCAKVGAPGQDLAILTGGLRFSMCMYDHYPAYFEALAKAEVAKIPIACEFPVPKTPNGGAIDTNTIELQVTDSGTAATIHQVHDETECASGGFYVDAGQIVLCESTCTEVQASNDGSLEVSYGCATDFVPR